MTANIYHLMVSSKFADMRHRPLNKVLPKFSSIDYVRSTLVQYPSIQNERRAEPTTHHSNISSLDRSRSATGGRNQRRRKTQLRKRLLGPFL